MSPATSTQVRRRQAVRRDALARQRQLNEERRRRDEQELELAADFALRHEESAAARQAVHAAELEMGRIIDELIGTLRVRYPRAAQLLDMPEDELRRLRQLAAEPAPTKESSTRRTAQSGAEPTATRRSSKRRTPGPRSDPAEPTPVTVEPQISAATAQTSAAAEDAMDGAIDGG